MTDLRTFWLFRKTPDRLSPGKKTAFWAWNVFILFCAGVCLGGLSLFFAYGDYTDLLMKSYFTVPLIPGIMPLISATMFSKIMNMAGATIPFELRVLFDRFREDKKAMYEIGIAYSVTQILELLANDADGIHIYTMNNARVAGDIYERINNVIEKELR